MTYQDIELDIVGDQEIERPTGEVEARVKGMTGAQRIKRVGVVPLATRPALGNLKRLVPA